MQTVLRILAAAASGVLLTFALPPVSCWPLGFVALVPLFAACRGRRFILGFLLAIVTGMTVAWLSVGGYLYEDKSMDGGATWIQLGCAMFGSIIGVIGAFFAETKSGDYRRILGLAATAVLLEWMMLRILPVTFALTEANAAGMRMLASWFGIWSVSFVLWYINLLLAYAVSTTKFKPVGWVAGGIVILLIAGAWWTADRHEMSSDFVATVTLVQSDRSASELFKMSGNDPDSLAVWPEFGGIMAAPLGNSRELRSMSETDHAPSFVTSFQDDFSPKPHNVAALFSKGKESARYEKRLLFGGERTLHTPGEKPVAVEWNGHRVGLNICFDSCSPSIMRETAALGVDLIVLPTIDPPTPHHWLAAMHAAFTPFRSAELGISIVRDDAFAYSMVTDWTGNIFTVPPGERTVRNRGVGLLTRRPLSRVIGDGFVWVCLALLIWSLNLDGLLRKAREARPKLGV